MLNRRASARLTVRRWNRLKMKKKRSLLWPTIEGDSKRPYWNVTVRVAFALAAKSYVEEAGFQVPNGDLGFRCSAEMCRRPAVPIPFRPGQPAHFEHIERGAICPFGDRLVTESRMSTVAESWLTVDAAAAIGRSLGRSFGDGNSSTVPVPRPRRPPVDNSRAAVPEPYDPENDVIDPAACSHDVRTEGLREPTRR
jgi:hypothetical protein